VERLKVSPGEVEESFILSGGPGGQNVNRRASCVLLRHRPTGLTVRCQQERSQALNRFLAWRRLLQRIEEHRLGQLRAEREKIEKIRRQKRRRSRRAKLKMLADKRHHSEKKQARRKLSEF